jgi:hypothetical protein
MHAASSYGKPWCDAVKPCMLVLCRDCGRGAAATALSYSPTGELLAAGFRDGTIELYLRCARSIETIETVC